jgi:hypothetical protein
MLVKKVRREGTLTLPSPAHDRGRGHKKTREKKERSGVASVGKESCASQQTDDQQPTSADIGGALRGLVKKALPRSTPTPTLPQDTGEGVRRRAAATQNIGERVRRARVSVKKAPASETRR